jgi:TM2 domain-containing membrane protein YozV
MPPVIAALCSLLLPGLGQLFRGQIAKGLLLIVLYLVGVGTLLPRIGGDAFRLAVFNLVIAVDAYLLARKKGRVRPWQWFG